MKKIFISVVVILAFLLLTLVGCSKDATNPFKTVTAGQVVTLAVPATTYWGAGTPTKNVKVYLPPGYDVTDTNTKYPVIYLLHGIGKNENQWINEFRINTVLDEMIANGDIEPVIVVMPNGANATGGGFYSNSNFGAAEYWIIDSPPQASPTPASVVGYIEQAGQYGNKIDNTRRFIMGVSMGGYGAWRIMLKHPAYFEAIVTHSAVVDIASLMSSVGPNPSIGEYDLRTRISSENTGHSYFDYGTKTVDPLGRIRYPLSLALLGLSSSWSDHVGQLGNYPASYFDVAVWLGTGKGTAPIDSTKMYQYPLVVAATGAPVTPATPATTVCLGVDLPVRLQAPSGRVRTDTTGVVITKWLNNDIYTSINAPSATNLNPNLTTLGTKRIFFDCGLQDDFIPADDGAGFGLITHNDRLDALLTAKSPTIAHTYETYTGTHTSETYWRSRVALKFLVGK